MEIAEVVARKTDLAASIQKLVADFNKATGLVTYSCCLNYRDVIGTGRELCNVSLTVELP